MIDRQFKSFDKDGKEIDVILRAPSQSQISTADFAFKKHFSDAVRGGMLTNAEVNKLLKDRGSWTDEHDLQVLEMRGKILELESSFKNNQLSLEEGMELRNSLKRLRGELAELSSIYSSVADNTADAYAYDARIRSLIAMCSFYKDGRRIYKDANDLNDQITSRLANDLYKKALVMSMEINSGVEIKQDLDAAWPEDAWMAAQQERQEEEKDVEAVVVEKPKRGVRKKKNENE